MSVIYGEACGKLILSGEHAVVYGSAAVGLGIGSVSVHVSPSDSLILSAPSWNLECGPKMPGRLGQALSVLAARFGIESDEGCRLLVESKLRPGAGLGSSAALSVALVRALCRWRALDWPSERQHLLAHELERIFHSRASGMDDTLAFFGGMLVFGEETKMRGLSGLGERVAKRAWRLDCPPPPLLIAHSGVAHDTGEMVGSVARRLAEDGVTARELLGRIDGLAMSLPRLLLERDYRALGCAFNANHEALNALGVGHKRLDELHRLALEHGAWGAKLSGAGGGGVLMAVAPESQHDVIRNAWSSASFEILDVE